ncbi:hydrolase [Actinomadura sp. NBRC 104425]|uniref:dienelactone hydrolase family protein n=1 Tax=Actinomadura sp. NBRC 104425 TaxID=3032204 RepID=UPI0024A1DE00|nr:dienelactone hydrolase family protein [Actinomadura sp. NBRC 104425]GLZ15463.1 hydrolase [Actinomadura sp. NBRC 104425]
MITTGVTVALPDAALDGDLVVPDRADGVVLFAHGSGSSRFSPRNRAVASGLNTAGFGTLLLDLLTADEERVDAETAALRFDIDLLARRLVGAVDWLGEQPQTEGLPIGLFGASTGAAGALAAAADRPDAVGAVVSRGGRPDLAGDALGRVRAPALLIVGGADPRVLELNDLARHRLRATHKLKIIAGAGHLFEEPGALEQVTELATRWFAVHLTP